MRDIDPLRLTTRQERIAGLVIAAVSVALHLLVVFGGVGVFTVEEPLKPQRLVRVRPMPQMRREEVPPRPVEVNTGLGSVAEQVRRKKEEEAKKKPPKPKTEEELPAKSTQPPTPETKAGEEIPGTILSVLTDQNQATFALEGAASYKGGGTYWEKRDVPPGSYRVVFGPLPGYDTPAPQEGSIERQGKLSFVGRYSKMIMVNVNVVPPDAKFIIKRPDGRELDMRGLRQAQFKGLPAGTYTIYFGDIDGQITPGPYTATLGKDGLLAFSGVYRPVPPRTPVVAARPQRQAAEPKAPVRSSEPAFDKRVQVIVTSYPETSIERNYGAIAYPERAISRGNYQEGWCQVYLILSVDDGQIKSILVERPSEKEQARFAALIDAVKAAVSAWRFDRTRAEVHVDARFFVER